MNLSNDMVSQFVKMTNDKPAQSTTDKVYGTVVIYDEKNFVKIDGSDLLTPADTTVHIKNDERVTVTIKDHTATIDGNVTDISASNQHLIQVENDFVDFKVDTEGMFVTIRDEFNTKFADFKLTVDGMFLEVRNEVDKKFTNFQVTVDGMLVTVKDELNGKYSSLQQTVNGIQTEVSKKVDGTQIGTIVTQNAESWKLSINGKLSGTNYNFDGKNFSIGSSSGNTKAYHSADYSKWTHSDGSWTQVSASGMTWSKGGTTTGYHCLLYAGEYTCNSEQTVTITLPSEFKGKPFKVVTSIKRIYISDTNHVLNCRFPLISFYAEALNVNQGAGTFQVYASIRAWNRTSYGGWGTLIGNGTTANEREAIKPVVAYWAFV